MLLWLTYGLLSFFLSLLGVLSVRQLGKKYGWVSKVTKDRWHQTPTVLMGGIGIVFSFLTISIIAYWNFENPPSFILPLLIGSTGSFLLGLVDDIYHCKPITKLIGQTILATIFIMGKGQFEIFPWPIFNILLTYLWFIGVMNAVNLLDNMDGLASGVVVIATSTLLTLLILQGATFSHLEVLIPFIFIMAIIGFWIFNRYPASIFMGDCGSLFLGYTLAALAIPTSLTNYSKGPYFSSTLSLLVPVTILAIPIFDTTLVTLTRKASGRPLSIGGKDHSSHRLVGLGFSESMSVTILHFLTLLGGLTAILMTIFKPLSLAIFGIYSLGLLIAGLYLGKRQVYPKDETAKGIGWTPLVAEIMYKKGIVEILLDLIAAPIAYFLAIKLSQTETLTLTAGLYQLALPSVILITVIAFRVLGVYSGVWNLLSLEDLYVYTRAVLITSSLIFIVNQYILTLAFPLTTYFIFTLLLFFVVISSRLSFRFFDTVVASYGLKKRKRKILLYGAGMAGKLAVDEIKRNPVYKDIFPFGFLDDDPFKQGRKVSGIKVIGKLHDLQKILSHHGKDIQEMWISSRNIPEEKLQFLIQSLPSDIIIKNLKIEIAKITPH